MSADSFKRAAAEAAVALVQPGMSIGLGTGSTALFATQAIGARLREGSLRDIVAIATSKGVDDLARELGIPLQDDAMPRAVDLTIDGADEVDPDFNLIKGAGGALLREKVVAEASAREVIVVDESKLSPRLGTRFPVPVEVLEFGWQSQAGFLAGLGAEVVPRRKDGQPFRTDQGNLVLDCRFGPIADAHALAARLAGRAGVVEHGLFLGLVHDVIVAGPGGVRHLRRGDP